MAIVVACTAAAADDGFVGIEAARKRNLIKKKGGKHANDTEYIYDEDRGGGVLRL